MWHSYNHNRISKTMYYHIDGNEKFVTAAAARANEDIDCEYVEYLPPLCPIHSNPIEGLHTGCTNCHSPSPSLLMRILNIDFKKKSRECSFEFLLMVAICYNREDVVRYVLQEERLDLDLCYEDRTPLCCAVRLGYIEIAKLLLEKGVKTNTGDTKINIEERSPVHIAARNGSLELLQLLVSYGANINLRDGNRRTPLHLATLYGHSHLIKWLLSAGAIINMLQGSNMSALHSASCLGHFDICRMLVAGGAYMSFCNDDGWAALHSAVSYGFEDIVKLLLDAGADKTMRIISTNDTVLHIACSKGSVAIIRLLLKAGVPIEGRNFQGYTPLLTAVEYNDIYSAFFLIKAGANVNAVTNEGLSVVGLSLSHEKREILTTILVQSGAIISKEVCASTEQSTWLETYIVPISSNPRSLQDLCHVIIRQTLAPNLQTKFDRLPIPAALKRITSLKDVGLQVLHPEYGVLAANVNADDSDLDSIIYSVKGLVFEPTDDV